MLIPALAGQKGAEYNTDFLLFRGLEEFLKDLSVRSLPCSMIIEEPGESAYW